VPSFFVTARHSTSLLGAVNRSFTFRNPRILTWLALIVVASIILAWYQPPAFWLCWVGAALVVIGQLTNSARTGQWMSWQNEGSLDWFEGWAVSTGVIMAIVPLAGVIIRSATF